MGATTTGPAPVATAAIAASSEPDCPSSPAFSAGGANKDASSGSSPSAASSSSSSDHFNLSTYRRQNPSTSPLCFGAGGAGMLLWSSSKALARASKNPMDEAAHAASMAPKGDLVGRLLRRISRRLRKARAAKESSPPRGGAVDDTARERAEAVASAIAYCKETLRRGTSPSPPLSSPSLDWWLHDMQEIIASAAAHCDECGDSPWPRRDRSLLERQVKGTHLNKPSPPRDGSLSANGTPAHCNGSPHHGHLTGDITFLEPPANVFASHAPRMRLPYIHDAWAAAAAAETGKPTSPSDAAAGELGMRGSFSELEFLKTFDGDEELISRHFITVRI